jgi:uncharacterized membrane protein
VGKLIGALFGLLLGRGLDDGTLVTLALALAGFVAGVVVDRQRAAQRVVPVSDVAARLAAIERRLDALEGRAAEAPRVSPRQEVAVPPGIASPDAAGDAANAPPVADREAVAVPLPATLASPSDDALPPRPAYGVRSEAQSAFAGYAAIADVKERPQEIVSRAPPRRGAWAWFTEGNTMTRVGVVILFFGVAFLLSWFADHLALSIDASLALVALVGGALVAVGAKLAPSRPGYALSLQGAGAGILYLATFAASRLFDVLPPVPALVALGAVATLTVALAWRADSQAMAGLAMAGGFLAPFLVARTPGEPGLLFAWFAVINAAIFALAWHRAWRALNALGAVFTFGLGIFWGWRWYSPQHFAIVQPFLALYFAFYLGVAILYAKRAPLESRKPVDALIVFGVPVAAFALEAGLLTDRRYGAAIAAAVVAAIYAALHVSLRHRQEPGLRLLAQSFIALAVVFGTLAVPFAVDARWTSAWWALEAAAVYWIGCRQDQRLARAFALALQACAAAAFVAGGLPRGAMPVFANASFFGAAMIGIAALASAWSADRHRDIFGARERTLVALVFAWGVAWWMLAGVTDVARARPAWLGPGPGNAALAWVVASVAVGLALRPALRWSRLAWVGAAAAPAMVLAGLVQFHDARTTLVWPGGIVWPLAWALHWATLHAVEASVVDGERGADGERMPAPSWLRDVHTASAVALVAWASWEASEWAGRVTPRGSAWIACAAALPAMAGLAATLWSRAMARWPFARFPDAYAKHAGWIVAPALAAWFVGTNVVSPGNATPLPWLPLANPLDVTLAAALAAVVAWARAHSGMPRAAREHWLGGALFVAGNGFLLRVAHHWGGVPWRLSSLLADKTVQAALTLAWTATALVLMVWASRRASRARWLTGAALLAVVVVKLFVVDLATLSGLQRVVAFLGVGAMLLAVGYFAPPPARGDDDPPPESTA